MGVLSKVGNFFNRHRNKFFITAAVITSAVLASKYAHRKLREWQELQTKEFLDRTRKQQHFESTERTCNSTFMSLSTRLNEELSNLHNSAAIIAQLYDSPLNRRELWDKLKICVFTRLTTLIYTNVMLIIILRIQLNLIGGYIYKDTKSISKTLQENYLSMSQVFLDKSLLEIAKSIEEKVTTLLNEIDLKQNLNLYDIEHLFSTIQVQINEKPIDAISNLRKYVIPEEHIQHSDEIYCNMVKETADLLESEEVKSLTLSCITSSFTGVVDKLSELFTLNGTMAEPSTSANVFAHPTDVHKPLAKIIPILNGLLNRNSFPDDLVHKLVNNEKLKILGANIYEAFSNPNV